MTAPIRLAFFQLPLELAPTTNVTIGRNPYAITRLRKRCHDAMLAQYLRQFGDTKQRYKLNGVRRVVCTRHSSSKPDSHANWSKIPIDVLCRRTLERPHRLGLLFDDADKYAQVEERWESASPRKGYVTIEVFE